MQNNASDESSDMPKNFIESYVGNQQFLQNPPQDHKDFTKYCQKLGLMKERVLPRETREIPIKSLLEFGVTANNSMFASSHPGNPFDARTELQELIEQRSLTSPLFDNAHPDKDVVDQYYSTFQFIQIDKIANNIFFDDEDIHALIKLSVTMQNVYMPYYRSGGKLMQMSGYDEHWLDRKKAFSLNQYLIDENLEISSVLRWYQKLPDLAKPLLGIPRLDSGWIELWKNIAWSKKEVLEGDVRRGIEYLQWAAMLKLALRDYKQAEVLDIDEIYNLVPEQILDYVPSEMDERATHVRAWRNYYFTDPKTGINYYHDKYRRLNYLANSFRLEYQPKVILFVEGYIEEEVLPIIFEAYSGLPGSFGIEIKSLDGVDNLKATHDDIVQLQALLKQLNTRINKKFASKDEEKEIKTLIKRFERVDIVTSNWEAFINFNLEKWQAIPFFLADNEGELRRVLNASKVLKYQGLNMDVPKEWQFLWGVTNKQSPWVGDSFEMANFSDDEICNAVKELYGDVVPLADVQTLRTERKGLGSLIDKLNKQDTTQKRIKLDVAVKLAKNMVQLYEDNEDLELDRPVFAAIDKIKRIASLNHAPTNMLGEIENRKAILEQINGKLLE